MRSFKIFLLIIIFSNYSFLRSGLASELISYNNLPVSTNIKEKILNGNILTNSKVQTSEIEDSNTRTQKMNFFISGLHPKPCAFVLRKLSKYENYKDYMSFITRSNYDIKKKIIDILISSKLISNKISIIFAIPRITRPGVYPFVFKRGFLKNLKGTVHVSKHDSKCLFYIDANWSGKYSGYSDNVLEFFSSTLAQLTMEKLFRISTVY